MGEVNSHMKDSYCIPKLHVVVGAPLGISFGNYGMLAMILREQNVILGEWLATAECKTMHH